MSGTSSRPQRTCPQCQQRYTPSEECRRWRPFCSERCKLIDLGSWLDESNRISSDDDGLPLNPDGFSDSVH